MPKVRRKRRTARKNQLARPLKKSVESAPASIEESKAKYFDVANQPDESIKSKKTGEYLRGVKLPRGLKVPADWDVQTGDVISWSEGRPTETYFVTADRTLLKNPDTSGSGYLTIPLSITSRYSDAFKYFSSVLDGVGRSYVSSIELSPTDAFFSSNFSKKSLPTAVTKRNDILYSFDPNDEILYVTLESNHDRSKQFSLDSAKTEEIIEWISNIDEFGGSFTVSYDFQGKDLCEKAPRGVITGLPSGWQCEQQGSMSFGGDHIQGKWKCQGPEKTKNNAKKAIEQFYKGFNVDIE